MFLLFNIIFCLFTLRYELEKKSSLATRAFSAKSCTRDTDSLHSCTRLRLVQEMACLYHSCKILPRKHSYPNLIPIIPDISTSPNISFDVVLRASFISAMETGTGMSSCFKSPYRSTSWPAS